MHGSDVVLVVSIATNHDFEIWIVLLVPLNHRVSYRLYLSTASFLYYLHHQYYIICQDLFSEWNYWFCTNLVRLMIGPFSQKVILTCYFHARNWDCWSLWVIYLHTLMLSTLDLYTPEKWIRTFIPSRLVLFTPIPFWTEWALTEANRVGKRQFCPYAKEVFPSWVFFNLYTFL